VTRPDTTTDPELRDRLYRGQRTAAANKTTRTRNTVAAAVADAGPDGIRTRYVIRRTGLSRSTVIRTLNALTDDGVVSRRPDPRDARIVRYHTLTEGA